eukprot:Rhum_TRINITY_DN12098_c0_g1::Rhum_TRINITY_DN12098_c0_g1_i1::g.49193::m.49193/K14684/SLC25A23S; solute carrier family 25 (mitochondrial phosphate transporter), member 23/24/25/41
MTSRPPPPTGAAGAAADRSAQRGFEHYCRHVAAGLDTAEAVRYSLAPDAAEPPVDAAGARAALRVVVAGRRGDGEPASSSASQTALSLEEYAEVARAARLYAVFAEIDADGSGHISRAEVQGMLARKAAARGGGGQGSKAAAAAAMVRTVDADTSGDVSFDEFHATFGGVREASVAAICERWATLSEGVDFGTDLAYTSCVPEAALRAEEDDDAEHSPFEAGTLLRFLLAGGLGGIVSRTATAPFETMKIQSQVASESPGLLAGLRAARERHGVAGLFRGNLVNCARVFPFTGTVCLVYAGTLRHLPPRYVTGGREAYEPAYRAFVGGVAGGAATLATYPMDLVRARVTVGGGSEAALAVARQVYAEAGVSGLYKGVGPTLAAMVPFVAFQQSIYDLLRAIARSQAVEDSPALFLACGALAGAGAQTLVYPMDVVRRKAQAGASPSTFGSVFQRFGARGLLSGLGPTYAKVAPSVAISLTVRDIVKDVW